MSTEIHGVPEQETHETPAVARKLADANVTERTAPGASAGAGPLTAAPVAEGERIEAVDTLRGFALLGVLLMNMQAFAMPLSAYMNPTSYGANDALNFSIWCINHVAADGKFITIFSMLFGAGIVLMTSRARERAGRSAWFHYRRMLWLFVFGGLHGILIWYGDILLTYSICGMIVYWFRRRGPWLLVILGIVLLCIPTLLLANFRTVADNMPPEDLQEMKAMWSPAEETIAEQVDAYQGGYLDHLPKRFESWKSMFGFILIFGWRIIGVMLLGMALLKTGVLSGARSKGFYVALIVIGFVLGLPLAAFGIRHQIVHDWNMIEGIGPGSLYNYVGSLFAAFAWIGVIMLLCRADLLAGFKRRLAAVGRMAFTNYIMHSVICTTIFYGHGFGLFGRVNRVGQLGVVVVIAALQLWYSPLWLQRFRFGPLEWLWRTLTYWKAQPFRRAIAG